MDSILDPLVDQGRIEKVPLGTPSPASSSAFVVWKAGKPRVVVDLRKVNTFPDSLNQDPFVSVTVEEFHQHCSPYTVLPDFWKHWAQVLKVDREPFKLDFNAEGYIATNLMCHGAAATVRGNDGRRRFVVWDGYEMLELETD